MRADDLAKARVRECERLDDGTECCVWYSHTRSGWVVQTADQRLIAESCGMLDVRFVVDEEAERLAFITGQRRLCGWAEGRYVASIACDTTTEIMPVTYRPTYRTGFWIGADPISKAPAAWFVVNGRCYVEIS